MRLIEYATNNFYKNNQQGAKILTALPEVFKPVVLENYELENR